MSTSPPPPPRRLLAPPIWTHAETLALLDAYRAKLLQLRRHNLRLDDWTPLAAEVTRLSSDSPNSSPKSPAQCRCKIEKLRKRFRNECGKPATSWPYFHLLRTIDDLVYGPNDRQIAGAVVAGDQKEKQIPNALTNGQNIVEAVVASDRRNNQVTNTVINGQNHHQSPSAVSNGQNNRQILRNNEGTNLNGQSDSQITNTASNGQNSRRLLSSNNTVTSGQNTIRFLNSVTNSRNDRRFLGSVTNGQKDRGILNSFTNDKNSCRILHGAGNGQDNRRVLGTLMASGGFRFKVPKATRSKLSRVRVSGWVGPRREKKKKRVRCDFFGEFASAVKGFGVIYERVEERKMEAAREIENMRMEMEMKRTEMILELQRKIVDAFVNGKSGTKMAKVSVQD